MNQQQQIHQPRSHRSDCSLIHPGGSHQLRSKLTSDHILASNPRPEEHGHSQETDGLLRPCILGAQIEDLKEGGIQGLLKRNAGEGLGLRRTILTLGLVHGKEAHQELDHDQEDYTYLLKMEVAG